ncbi:MAG: trypsin-like peptidase domain-containing protein [Acidimicrobiia bacterium]|nr:trypsin-like peptidase domain-containing protein [Actinomycetota bacterium]MBL6926964.1 trypsin-like peptidase domain-containing protein [Acidimicrobiia bacterium]
MTRPSAGLFPALLASAALLSACGQPVVTPPLVDPPVPVVATTSAPPTHASVPVAPDEALIERTWQSVVRVNGLGCIASQVGSGFVVSTNLVVTSAHVIAGLDAPEVTVGEVTSVASVVAFDPVSDLALLEVDIDLPRPLALDAGAEGQMVAVLAYSDKGERETDIARIIRPVRAVGDDIYGEPGGGRNALEIEAVVNSGNSGGPVVDVNGAVVGVLFSRTRGGVKVAYAVQASEIKPLLASARNAGLVAVDPGDCRAR